MKDLFYYQREVKTKVPSEVEGEKVLDEKGNPVMKEVTYIVWDCINLNCVVRAHWTSPDVFTIMLNDGHEQADDVQKPVWKNAKIVGAEIKRERAWFMSQIEISKEDALRFREVTDININKWNKDEILASEPQVVRY